MFESFSLTKCRKAWEIDVGAQPTFHLAFWRVNRVQTMTEYKLWHFEQLTYLVVFGVKRVRKRKQFLCFNDVTIFFFNVLRSTKQKTHKWKENTYAFVRHLKQGLPLQYILKSARICQLQDESSPVISSSWTKLVSRELSVVSCQQVFSLPEKPLNKLLCSALHASADKMFDM